MLSLQQRLDNANQNNEEDDQGEDDQIREIHALSPSPPPPRQPPPPPSRPHQRSWSTASASSSENFTTMSREFNALVIAGSSLEIDNNNNNNNNPGNDYRGNAGNNGDLTRIGEDDDVLVEDSNPLAIVPDTSGFQPSAPGDRRRDPVTTSSAVSEISGDQGATPSVQRVKREEVETKITAWQNAKISKINNRFKRDDAVINGWENEQIQKANSWMKKIERKLEEKRVRALEKMQNDVAKARRKAEERRASAEAKRGTKVARVLEIANLMRAVGRPPAKRSFF